MTPSMSRKGNCSVNACSNTLFDSLQVERLHGEPLETMREAKDEAIAWLLWYHRTQMHSTLHGVSLMQFQQDWTEAARKVAASVSGITEKRRRKRRFMKSPKNDSTVFHPYREPWESIQPIPPLAISAPLHQRFQPVSLHGKQKAQGHPARPSGPCFSRFNHRLTGVSMMGKDRLDNAVRQFHQA